jgi:hypothetical protein
MENLQFGHASSISSVGDDWAVTSAPATVPERASIKIPAAWALRVRSQAILA